MIKLNVLVLQSFYSAVSRKFTHSIFLVDPLKNARTAPLVKSNEREVGDGKFSEIVEHRLGEIILLYFFG